MLRIIFVVMLVLSLLSCTGHSSRSNTPVVVPLSLTLPSLEWLRQFETVYRQDYMRARQHYCSNIKGVCPFLPPQKMVDNIVKRIAQRQFSEIKSSNTDFHPDEIDQQAKQLLLVISAFKAEYFDIIQQISPDDDFFPSNVFGEIAPSRARLAVSIVYDTNVLFNGTNSAGFEVENLSPFPRRKSQSLGKQDESIYIQYLREQLAVVSGSKPLKHHHWSLRLYTEQNSKFKRLYSPFIADKTCVGCHLESVKTHQRDKLYELTLKELLDPKARKSPIYSRLPKVDEIFGLTVVKYSE